MSRAWHLTLAPGTHGSLAREVDNLLSLRFFVKFLAAVINCFIKLALTLLPQLRIIASLNVCRPCWAPARKVSIVASPCFRRVGLRNKTICLIASKELTASDREGSRCAIAVLMNGALYELL